jgi:FkbM family methyltransferase
VLLEASIVDGRLGRFDTAGGSVWLPIDSPDDVIVRDIRAGLLCEGPVIRTLLPFIRPGTAVLDIGANVGQTAIAFSDAVESDGRVHAIEADDALAEICERNVLSRPCNNVIVHRAAAGDTGCPAPVTHRFGSTASSPVASAGRDGARGRTLLVDEIDVQRPLSAIKVGARRTGLRALIGARRTIARHRPAVIFKFEQLQAEFATSFQDWVDFVASIDYRFDRIVSDINYLVLPRTTATHRSEPCHFA